MIEKMTQVPKAIKKAVKATKPIWLLYLASVSISSLVGFKNTANTESFLTVEKNFEAVDRMSHIKFGKAVRRLIHIADQLNTQRANCFRLYPDHLLFTASRLSTCFKIYKV